MAITNEQTAAKPVDTAAVRPAETETAQAAGIPAATGIAPSGAPLQTTEIDLDHPAVDNNPRAGTTELANRADFNDPVRPGHDVVAESLTRQGVPTKSGAEAAKSLKSGK